MDARIGSAGFPPVQMGLGLLQALEALTPFSGVFLACPTPDSTFPLRSGIPNPTGQGHHAVVSQHILEYRGFSSRIVIIRKRSHPREGCPGRCTERLPPSRRNTVSCSSAQMSGTGAEASAVEPLYGCSPSVITNSRVRRYLPVSGWRTIGPVSVVDLGFFPRSSLDDAYSLGALGSTQLAHEAFSWTDSYCPKNPDRKPDLARWPWHCGHDPDSSSMISRYGAQALAEVRDSGAGRSAIGQILRPPESGVTPYGRF